MPIRILAFISLVFITAAPLAGIGMAGTDCSVRPCCCSGPATRTQSTGAAMIGPARGCCCAAAGEAPCTYAPSQLPQNARWALSSARIDAPASALSAMTGFTASRGDLETGVMPDAEDQFLHIVSPPTYLSLMSFLR